MKKSLFWGVTLLWVFLPSLPLPAAGIIPDTGQTTCYNNSVEITCPEEGEAFWGQDASYAGPTRSYTKLGIGGVNLSESASPADGWLMTKDTVTGLTWEVKTDDNSVHDKDNTYSWCDTNPDTNGGHQGTCGVGTNSEDYVNTLNTTNFGGYNDWRLPTPKELASLTNNSIPPTTNDPVYFPNTMSDESWWYWSSASIVDPTLAYLADIVKISTGYTTTVAKSSYNHIIAVRGSKLQEAEDRFHDNGDGTITDRETGLMWQQHNAIMPDTEDWNLALAYANSLTLAGFSDWRLPNRNELQSIVNYSAYPLSINASIFQGTAQNYYWSSTTNGLNADTAGGVWCVHFKGGGVYPKNKLGTHSYGIRAVRGGLSGILGDSVVTVVEPSAGSANGGTEVILFGRGFGSAGGSVTFGGSTAMITGWSDTRIICTTPHHTPGNEDVVVNNTGGQHAALIAAFTFINSTPSISGTPITSVDEDSLYSFTAMGSDDDIGDTLSYSITHKPSWASFSESTGQLAGTPTNADVGITAGIVITVTDSSNATASLPAFDLEVNNVNDPPTISGIPATLVNEDSGYSFTATGSDDDIGDTLTYSITNKPPWANFNESTGQLAGTPTNADVGITAGIVITVTDTSNATALLPAFDIEVNNVNDPPTISGIPITEVDKNHVYTFTPTGSDIDAGDTLAYSITNKPSWASFSESTGQLSGTPANADVGITAGIVITVTDTSNAAASLPAFDIEVNNIYVTILNDPTEYTTIQAAIDAAIDGDTVLVAAGTYTGDGNYNIDFKGKAITVRSEQGPEATIIDCAGNGRGFYFHTGEDKYSVLSGLSIVNGVDSGGKGAGIYCASSSPTITNCIISGNSTTYGAGIYLSSSSAIISNSTITENSSSSYGGGIYFLSSSPTISDCIITGNRSNADGGGMYCRSSSPTITNTTISNNSARMGGGLNLYSGSSPIITNCTISGNSSSSWAGGVWVNYDASVAMTNTTISGNYSPLKAGGIYVGGPVTLTNCTISGNFATEQGGAIYAYNRTPVATNSIFWGNSPDEIVQNNGDVADVTYSVIMGGYPGEGNNDADPLFVNPLSASLAPSIDGDYHITSESPCKNTGTWLGAPTDDIDGEDRPGDSGYDIGSDEFAVNITADCNGDWGGRAFFDNCNICVSGNTGLEVCAKDCNDDWGGTAVLDSCSICVGGNTGLTPCTRTLSVTLNGSGDGLVTSVPTGISCGVECTQEFENGASVLLYATATNGSVFSGWSGACSGSADCEVTLGTDTSATATFESTYTLTAVANGGGTVSPPGAVTVVQGMNQSYTVTPDTGFHVVDVTVDSVSQGAISEYTFSNITSAHTIEAVFAINTYSLTATAGLGGSISSAGEVYLDHGSSHTYTVTTDTGYHIIDVLVDSISQGAISEYTFSNITSAHTIEALFVINTPPEIVQAGPLSVTMDEDGEPQAWSAPTLSATDVNQDSITWSVLSSPSHGTATVSGTGASPSLFEYVPETDWHGGDIFIVQISDGKGGSDSVTVNVTVNPINDAPVIDGIPLTTVAEGSACNFTPNAVDVDSGDSLSFSIFNKPAWATFDTATGALSGIPSDDDVGITTGIVITVTDTGDESASLPPFGLTVINVNDAPTFTKGPDQLILVDAGPQSVPAWATNISAGPDNESDQALTFELTTDNDALFLALPSVHSITGDLTYTAAANARGTAQITLTLKDDGGTENGGNNSSVSQTFTIRVEYPVPEAAIITITPNPANTGEVIEFTGLGGPVEQAISGYEWSIVKLADNNEQGTFQVLGTTESLYNNSLSIGDYRVYFRVQNSYNEWSPYTTRDITITGAMYSDLELVNEDILLLDDKGNPVTNPQVGENVKVAVQVHNLGPLDSQSEITVAIFDGLATGTPIGQSTIADLPMGGAASVQIPWIMTEEGCKILTAVAGYTSNIGLADADKPVKEASFQNNMATAVVQTGSAEACASGISVTAVLSDSTLYAGYDVGISGTALYSIAAGMPVMGAEVSIEVSGEAYETHTTSPAGRYANHTNLPASPGLYTAKVTVFDGSHVGIAELQLQIEAPPVAYPDLTADIYQHGIGFTGQGVYSNGHDIYSLAGDEITITVALRNRGAAAVSTPFNVTFYNGAPPTGVLLGTTVVTTPIGIGNKIIVTNPISWIPATPATHTIYAVIDADDAIVETNEFNNIASRTIKIREAKPDLRPVLSFSQTPVTGETVTLISDIYNAGQADLPAGSFTVKYFDGNPDYQGTLIGSEDVTGPLVKNDKLISTMAWDTTGVSTGVHSLYVMVDSQNSVDEDFENNNRTSSTLDIYTAEANLTPMSQNFSTYAPGINQAITINATIKNCGGVMSSGEAVEFYNGDPSTTGTLIGTANSGAIESGRSVIVATPWTTPGVSGWVSVYVVVANQSIKKSLHIYDAPPPDLRVYSSNILLAPSLPCDGDMVYMAADIENVGSTTAEDFTVKFYADSIDGTTLLGPAVKVQALNPSTILWLEAPEPFVVNESGYTLRVEIVPGIKGDANLADNQATTSFIDSCGLPLAEAGPDQTVYEGATVQLDASNSTFASSYIWRLKIRPSGASPAIQNYDTINPIFTPTVRGQYVLELKVSDGTSFSWDSLIINVENFVTPGDVDDNGEVNIIDSMLALEIVAGIMPEAKVYKDADVNGDASIGLDEALYGLLVESGLLADDDNAVGLQ